MVSVQEDALNLFDGRFDMAILPPESIDQTAVIRRTLWKSSRVMVASPSYLDRYGTPAHAAALSGHFLLLEPTARQNGTNFIDLIERGQRVSVLPMSSMDGDQALLRAAALTGTGIAALPQTMVREDILLGRLVPVLQGCTTSEAEDEVCLFYSHRELLPARFRTFVDFCTEFFRADHNARNSLANIASAKKSKALASEDLPVLDNRDS
jgi:DNA-binding transcriptional LysR family regulator